MWFEILLKNYYLVEFYDEINFITIFFADLPERKKCSRIFFIKVRNIFKTRKFSKNIYLNF